MGNSESRPLTYVEHLERNYRTIGSHINIPELIGLIDEYPAVEFRGYYKYKNGEYYFLLHYSDEDQCFDMRPAFVRSFFAVTELTDDEIRILDPLVVPE